MSEIAAELMMMNMTTNHGGMMMTTQAGPVAKRSRMWMWYHARIEDTVLIKQGKVFDVGTLIWVCFVVIAAGILLESIKYFRWVAKETMRKNPTDEVDTNSTGIFSSAHFVQTILYFLQICLAYILMNVYMVFSIWICLSLCLGLTIGHFLFASKTSI